jgi:hypothetical protein
MAQKLLNLIYVCDAQLFVQFQPQLYVFFVFYDFHDFHKNDEMIKN